MTLLRAVMALVAMIAAGPCRPARAGRPLSRTSTRAARALPDNLLRFYVYFSAPMGPEAILPSIALLDARGPPIDGVFLDNRYELWSPDRTRLTLLLDPGRVKTGQTANRAMGRALEAGASYRLRIARTARDARGCALSGPNAAAFDATAADLSPPAPADWELSTPVIGTRAPLTLTLDGPVDHLSLAYRLRVVGPGDARGSSITERLDPTNSRRHQDPTLGSVISR